MLNKHTCVYIYICIKNTLFLKLPRELAFSSDITNQVLKNSVLSQMLLETTLASKEEIVTEYLLIEQNIRPFGVRTGSDVLCYTFPSISGCQFFCPGKRFGRDCLGISHRLHFIPSPGPNATISKGGSLISRTPDHKFFVVIWLQTPLIKLRAKSSSIDQRGKKSAIQVKNSHAM